MYVPTLLGFSTRLFGALTSRSPYGSYGRKLRRCGADHSARVIQSTSEGVTSIPGTQFRSAVEALREPSAPSYDGQSYQQVVAIADAATKAWGDLDDAIRTSRASSTEAPAAPAIKATEAVIAGRMAIDSRRQREVHDSLLWASGEIGRGLRKLSDTLHEYRPAAALRNLLVLGEAGSGKSHLLASVVEAARRNDQPATRPWGTLHGK